MSDPVLCSQLSRVTRTILGLHGGDAAEMAQRAHNERTMTCFPFQIPLRHAEQSSPTHIFPSAISCFVL